MSEMTVKQRAFVEALPQNQWNGTKAAVVAGYSQKSAAVMACRLLKNPRIVAEIEKVKQRYLEELEQTDITIEELLKRLDRIYHESIDKGQYANAIKALELLGKHIGLFEQDNQQKAPKTLIVSNEKRMEQLEAELALLKRAKSVGSAICYG
jgi:phage terminase small subunit